MSVKENERSHSSIEIQDNVMTPTCENDVVLDKYELLIDILII